MENMEKQSLIKKADFIDNPDGVQKSWKKYSTRGRVSKCACQIISINLIDL